jgi:hypothetical protein
MAIPIKIKINDVDGRVKYIGEKVGREFRKTVNSSRHFLRKPPAICIEKQVFEELDGQIDWIRVHDNDKKVFWEVPAEVFKEHSFTLQRGGFAPQMGLELKWWDVYERGRKRVQEGVYIKN